MGGHLPQRKIQQRVARIRVDVMPIGAGPGRPEHVKHLAAVAEQAAHFIERAVQVRQVLEDRKREDCVERPILELRAFGDVANDQRKALDRQRPDGPSSSSAR